MTLTYPTQPLHILLFDNTDIYRRPVTQSLSAGKLTGNCEVACEHVDTPLAFQRALTSDWDAILIAYPVADNALRLIRECIPDRTCILLYSPAEEEQAFALVDERISDVMPLDGMRRLPLSLHREWGLKQCQESKLQLQRMEMRFRAIIEGFDDTVLITDSDQVIRYANSAFQRILGYPIIEILGRSLAPFFHPTEEAELQECLSHLCRSVGTLRRMKHRLQRADGAWAHMETAAHSLHDPAGDVVIVFHVRDVSERKVAQESLEQRVAERTAELQLAKERVEAILNHSPDGILLIRPDLSIQQSNIAFRRLFGYGPEEQLTTSLSRLAYEPDAGMVSGLVTTVTGEQVEIRAIRKDGKIFDVELSVSAINGDGFVCVIRDITERKSQERLLRFQASMQQTVSDAVIVTDREFHIHSWNKAAERIYGWRAEEVINKSVIEVLRTRYPSAEESEQRIRQLRDQGWWQGEVLHTHKNGSLRHILGSVTAIKETGGVTIGVVAVNHDITERKQIEDALRESEARYRLLAETGFDMVSRNNLQGDFIYVSPSTERLLGYCPNELIGRPGFSVVHPDQHAQMAEALHHASQTREQLSPQIFQMRHKEGHYLLLELSIRAIFSEETGEVVEFISSARDITEQVRAEEALRASEEKFRQVAENFDHLLFMRSADNRQMLFINSATERITGITREQLYADPQMFLNHVHPEDLDYVRQQQRSQRYLEEGICDLEYRLLRVDGTIRWLRVRTFPIKNEHGVIVSRVGTIEDITERKEAELALQESEAKYRLLVETMHGGLVVFDTDDRMTYVTERFCELLGYSREELIGARPFDHLDATNAARVKEQLGRRRQLENSSYELAFRRPDGQLIHLLSLGSPLRDKAGNYNGGFAVVTDITAQKQAEDTLRQALAHEQELGELKSRFVSIASHEFRTPLATISATTETLIAYRHQLDAEQLDARLRKILSQVEHMKSMMEDVLQLARIQAGRMEFTPEFGDLSALCDNIVLELRSHPEYEQRINYDTDSSPVQFPFDMRLMRHILNNLLANGLKYSPNKEPITVELHQNAETVTVRISDRGIGIPDADLKHLFEPFHRAKNVGTISGTGLGLCITKEAVELHGGTIQIDTEIDVGTTVTVTFPTVTISSVTFPTNVERRGIHGDHSHD